MLAIEVFLNSNDPTMAAPNVDQWEKDLEKGQDSGRLSGSDDKFVPPPPSTTTTLKEGDSRVSEFARNLLNHSRLTSL